MSQNDGSFKAYNDVVSIEFKLKIQPGPARHNGSPRFNRHQLPPIHIGLELFVGMDPAQFSVDGPAEGIDGDGEAPAGVGLDAPFVRVQKCVVRGQMNFICPPRLA